MIAQTEPSLFWSNPTVVRIVALFAVMTLVFFVILLRRRKRSGHGAAIVCLLVSVALHGVILFAVPRWKEKILGGALTTTSTDNDPGATDVSVAMFDPDLLDADLTANTETTDPAASLSPLPVAAVSELLTPTASSESEAITKPLPPPDSMLSTSPPTSLSSIKQTAEQASDVPSEYETELDDILGDWLSETLQPTETSVDAIQPAPLPTPVPPTPVPTMPADVKRSADRPAQEAALIVGSVDEDFAARQGTAKTQALHANGGDADTEAAVAKALEYLASQQRTDGAWDPLQSGAGRERAPLGLTRGGAGTRCETGITGLALLSMLGSGHTHQDGNHQETVYRGLVYLLSHQKPSGSLAGNATVYAAHYCHAMAALSLAETAAMTGDDAAIAATKKAVNYTASTQHPATGGWRYTRGDTGDLSQLGWQAMLIDGALRADAIDQASSMQSGITRFLASVRRGRSGGLACYRSGEGPTPTMTAEALATRLLIGQQVSPQAIEEAESLLLRNLPGQPGVPDNYYYWYYATMALHQLQDEAWQTWNAALKERLLSTQRPDGSWPASTLWGGYGGTVYTTSMATLCLESYYRHSRRQ